MLAENRALKKWIEKQGEKSNSNEVVSPPPVSQELQDLVESHQETDGYIPEECFLSDYDESTLSEIMAQQMALVKVLKKNGRSKHLANRILIIFDDLVGSNLFSGKKNNPFKMLNTNHRHYSTSILMVSQAYKEIPKTVFFYDSFKVRTQFSCVIVFEIANEREVDSIYEENPMNLKRPQWDEMYLHATEGDHDFLFLNYQKPKRLRMMKNFQNVLFYK